MARSAISFAMAGFALWQTALAQTPPSAEQLAVLNAIREHALSDARSLPNYTCIERTRQTIAIRDFTLTETREDNCASQRNPLFATQAVALAEGPTRSVPGDPLMAMILPGEFGRLLGIVFDPETGADVRWDHVAALNGRGVNVFAFSVPQSRGYSLVESRRTIQVPFRGFVYADYQTGAVVRLEMKCTDIPGDSEYTAADLTLDYKPAKVGDQEFILPSHSLASFRMVRGRATNDAEYTSYRRFTSDSTIQFESADSKIRFEDDARQPR